MIQGIIILPGMLNAYSETIYLLIILSAPVQELVMEGQ